MSQNSVSEDSKSRVRALVTQYVDAWNEPDVRKREALLAQCWGEGAVYVDPTVELKGATTLSAHIAKVQAARPGAYLEFMSGIDVHHNVVRFLWRLVRADGTRGDTSIDFGEIGPDGRLTKIVGFFGPAPMA
ncbi:MAG: nuclear transport factor 2 family protein [Pseudomonadota bacterium]